MSHKKQSHLVKIFGNVHVRQSIPTKTLPVNTKPGLTLVPDRVAL